jgi:hypothetical protein
LNLKRFFNNRISQYQTLTKVFRKPGPNLQRPEQKLKKFTEIKIQVSKNKITDSEIKKILLRRLKSWSKFVKKWENTDWKGFKIHRKILKKRLLTFKSKEKPWKKFWMLY